MSMHVSMQSKPQHNYVCCGCLGPLAAILQPFGSNVSCETPFQWSFICPDHVLKIIGPIDCSPRQTFDLDAFSYHLIIGRTPECLAENFSSYQYHGKAKVDMFLL